MKRDNVKKITSLNDFRKLQNHWHMLQGSKDMTVFQTYEWNELLYKQWYRSRYNRVFSKVVVIEMDEAIVPLVVQRIGFGFKWFGRKRGAYLLGTDSYSDYLNIVYDSEKENPDLFNNIFHEIEMLKVPFYFCRVREDTSVHKWLQNNGYRIDKQNISVAVNLEAISSVEEYTKSLSKSTRQNLRTSLNRMHKDEMEYKFEVKRGILSHNLIEELKDIHLKRIMEINKKYTSILNRISNFFRRMKLKQIELNNNVVVDAMKNMLNGITVIVYCQGNIAGYLYGFVEGDNIRIIQNCVKDEYKFYSPMFRGTYDFICEMINNDTINKVDFTRGGEEYKYKLGGEDNKLFSYVFFRN